MTRGKRKQPERLSERTPIVVMRQSELPYNAGGKRGRGRSEEVFPPAHAGHESNRMWNVYSTIATDGGTLTETNTMPESNFTINQFLN